MERRSRLWQRHCAYKETRIEKENDHWKKTPLGLTLLNLLDLRRLEEEKGKKTDVMANIVLTEPLIVLSL